MRDLKLKARRYCGCLFNYKNTEDNQVDRKNSTVSLSKTLPTIKEESVESSDSDEVIQNELLIHLTEDLREKYRPPKTVKN